MIYIIGQENVLLKQPKGDRTLKMHHFSKKYEKVIFQLLVNPQRTPKNLLNPQRTPSEPPTYFSKKMKLFLTCLVKNEKMFLKCAGMYFGK